MSDRERVSLHFLADLTPAQFPRNKSGHASIQAAIERAIADAKLTSQFCKREIDVPGIKKREPDYFEQLCTTRRLAEEMLDVYSRGRRNGKMGGRAARLIQKLYYEMASSIKSLFWIVDAATPINEKILWRKCCQRL
jgi:hypothetical protein